MKREYGFTLVELLVVIAILGILLAMMVPTAGYVLRKANEWRARADAGVVVSALTKYYAEYNHWPSFYEVNGDMQTDEEWLETMNPDPDADASDLKDNMKRISFFEPGKGIVDEQNNVVDPWGNPYFYEVDVDYDDIIENPNPDKSDEIRATAIAWSAGEDGDVETWDDNCASWD